MDGPMPIEQSQHRCWEKVNKYSTFHSGRLWFAFLARIFYSKSHANIEDRSMGNQRMICYIVFFDSTGTPPLMRFSYTTVFYLTRFL